MTMESSKVEQQLRFTDDLAFVESAAHSEFLRSLLAHMQEGVSVTDLQGKRLLINRALCSMTGFSATELMTSQPPYPYWPSEEIETIDAIASRAATGDTTPVEVSLQRKDGERFPVLVRPSLVNDESGAVVAWFCTITDLTEAKRAAAALVKSERRWRAIAENPFDFVAIIDRNYAFRYLNHTLPELRVADVMATMTPFDFAAPEFHPAMREAFESAFRTGRASAYEVYSPQFKLWHSATVGAIQSDGEVRELALLARDISAAKATEHAARRSERRLALAIESVNDGLVELNLRTEAHAYSARTYQLLGFSDNDPALATHADGLTERLHPDERDAMTAQLKAAQYFEIPLNEDCRLQLRDGSYRWFQIRGRTVEEDYGEKCFMALLTDVTERHEVEEHRRLLATEVQQAQRLETIGTLAGGIAHDFNNLLTPIVGALELIQPTLVPQHPLQSTLRDALNAALRARQLTQQILTFARHGEADLAPVSLVELVNDELRRAATTAATPVETDFPAQSSMVLGDRKQLGQMVANLITNAQHAMQGVRGCMQVRIDRIELSHAESEGAWQIEPGPYARIVVSDQGVGMSESVQSRVFEPFFTTKPVGHGTGLGLAVVHGVVTRHGGHLRVRSERGRGTSVEVYLPEARHARVESRAPTFTQPPGMTGHIVCVDDEPAVLGVMKSALELTGFKVSTTTRPGEALEWIAASRPDATPPIVMLITDYRMPQLSGLELAQRVRSLKPELPIVLVTGYAEGLPQSTNPPGVTAVIQKPFRLSELTQCVEFCLAARRLPA